MSVPLALRIGPCSADAGTVALLHAVTAAPVSAIVQALKTGMPLPICDLFGLDHDEKERQVLSLLADLLRRDMKFEILFRGRVETIEVFHNLLETHHRIAYDTRMETELELSEPSEEALRWATGKFEREG
jgi:hypothetical protein